MGGGGYSAVNFGHLKSELFRNGGGVFWSKLWSSEVWSFPKLGGGGAFWSEIPERGFLENLDKNLLFSQEPACASQIVSHILRMWRLKSERNDSSRMRTARLPTARGMGDYDTGEEGYSPGGVWPWRGYGPGGYGPGGGYDPGGEYGPREGGVWPWGLVTWSPPPPSVDRQKPVETLSFIRSCDPIFWLLLSTSGHKWVRYIHIS